VIAAWMLYAVVVSAFLYLGARAAERALVAWRGHTRWVWVAAIMLAVAIPLWPRPTREFSPRESVVRGVETAPPVVVSTAPSMVPTWTVTAPRVGDDAWWLMVWIVASLGVALRYAVASRRLRVTMRSAHPNTMAGESVLLVPDGAPVLVGVIAPQIVVPAWLTEFDAALQTLVIAHEDEHRRAGDAWLVHALAVLLIALPWNVPLWLMGRRLRRAIEVDCDARVLARYPDVQRYGRVLLAVAQRRGLGASLIAPALAEPASLTEERIVAFTSIVRVGRATRAALVVVSVAAVMAACTAERGVKPVERAALAELPKMTVTAPPVVTADTTFVAVTAAAARTAQALRDSQRDDRARRDEVVRRIAVRASSDTTPVLKEFQVDKPASTLPGSPGPFYPAAEKARGESGSVLARFVVRADSTLDPASVTIVRASSEAFADAVRAAIPRMKFSAAELGGRTVAQLVQQPFEFQIR
jgi:TonB family protein